MTVCEKTFDLVADHLSALNYTGPVALSCDDTKLHGSLRLYWDGEKEAHFLVGAVGGPIQILDPDEIKAMMADPAVVKASKVRVIVSRLALNDHLHLMDLS
jgi:hypothetical protein